MTPNRDFFAEAGLGGEAVGLPECRRACFGGYWMCFGRSEHQDTTEQVYLGPRRPTQ